MLSPPLTKHGSGKDDRLCFEAKIRTFRPSSSSAGPVDPGQAFHDFAPSAPPGSPTAGVDTREPRCDQGAMRPGGPPPASPAANATTRGPGDPETQGSNSEDELIPADMMPRTRQTPAEIDLSQFFNMAVAFTNFEQMMLDLDSTSTAVYGLRLPPHKNPSLEPDLTCLAASISKDALLDIVNAQYQEDYVFGPCSLTNDCVELAETLLSLLTNVAASGRDHGVAEAHRHTASTMALIATIVWLRRIAKQQVPWPPMIMFAVMAKERLCRANHVGASGPMSDQSNYLVAARFFSHVDSMLAQLPATAPLALLFGFGIAGCSFARVAIYEDAITKANIRAIVVGQGLWHVAIARVRLATGDDQEARRQLDVPAQNMGMLDVFNSRLNIHTWFPYEGTECHFMLARCQQRQWELLEVAQTGLLPEQFFVDDAESIAWFIHMNYQYFVAMTRRPGGQGGQALECYKISGRGKSYYDDSGNQHFFFVPTGTEQCGNSRFTRRMQGEPLSTPHTAEVTFGRTNYRISHVVKKKDCHDQSILIFRGQSRRTINVPSLP